jgi:hypothetical protein
MLAGFLGLAILVLRLWPETPFARVLHRGLVEAPLALAERLERQHLILVVVVLLCGGQAMALLGPEVAMIYAADVSLYAEAVIAASVATAVARMRFVWHKFTGLRARELRLGQSRPRARRSRVKRALAGKAFNDGDPERAWRALAA